MFHLFVYLNIREALAEILEVVERDVPTRGVYLRKARLGPVERASHATDLVLLCLAIGIGGLLGLPAIHAGGLTIGQDEATCTVYGMPRACGELGVLIRVVPLSEIPGEILQAVRRRRPAS